MDKKYSENEIYMLVRLIQTEGEDNCVVLKRQLSSIIKKQPLQFKKVIDKEFKTKKPQFLQGILRDVYFQDLKAELKAFSQRQKPNLTDGLTLISKINTPSLKKNHIKETIDVFVEELSDSLSAKTEPEDICTMLSQGIFSILGFDIKIKDLQAQDIYFDRFLQNKSGGLFNIACLYVMLAKRFGIRLEILDIQGKILIECDDINFKNNCYIDVLNYGAISSETSLKKYLIKRDINLKLQDIKHFTSKQIIKRMLGNLIYFYNKENKPTNKNKLEYIREIFSNF